VTEEDARQRLAVNVRVLRATRELTQTQAAERAEIPLRQWQRVESGAVNVTLATLVKVAGVLGVEPADLLSEPSKRRLP